MCRNYLSVIARKQIGSWLRPKVDASDLVQQTLLEAHRGLARFEGRSREEWLAWLRQILARNAVDFVRHFQQAEKRCVGREVSLTAHRAGASDAVGFEPLDPADTPSQLVMQWERELQVADALTQLAADYQQVVHAAECRAIAVRRGCPANEPLAAGRADAVDAGDPPITIAVRRHLGCWGPRGDNARAAVRRTGRRTARRTDSGKR